MMRHHHRHHARSGPSTDRRERGAVLVEMAIIAIFLVTLFAGGYDFGQAWRTGLTVNEAARTGARVGSAQGPLREADFYALSGVKAALNSSGELPNVKRIVVFKATGNGKMPTACRTSSTSACQVITGADFRTSWETQAMTAATTGTGCLNIASAKNWCPTTRVNVLPGGNDPNASGDYYGIWIQVHHDYQFPLLGSGTDVERTTVMRLEPKVD